MMEVITLERVRLNGEYIDAGKLVEIDDQLCKTWERMKLARVVTPEDEKKLSNSNEDLNDNSNLTGSEDAGEAGEPEKAKSTEDGTDKTEDTVSDEDSEAKAGEAGEPEIDNSASSGANKPGRSKESSKGGRKQ